MHTPLALAALLTLAVLGPPSGACPESGVRSPSAVQSPESPVRAWPVRAARDARRETGLATFDSRLATSPLQEFKEADLIEKEKFTFGMPVTAKKGSRFSKLNLVPSGWELWVVMVNNTRVEQFGDADMPKPPIVEKARACTRIHEALSAEKESQIVITVVVRRPGNSRGILVQVTFPGWDASLEYAWRKWRQNPSMIILPMASTNVGAEPFPARVTYSEAERLEEVAAYEMRKREDAEDKKTPGLALKLKESYGIAQRRLRLDAGIQRPESQDDAYFAARRTKGQNLLKRADERMSQGDLFEAHRLARAGMAIYTAGGQGSDVVDRVKASIGLMEADAKGRLRAKVLSQAMGDQREKRFTAVAEAAAFCLLMTETDKEATRLLAQTRKAAFADGEMEKGELDRWLGILGPPADLPSLSELKEDVLFRVTGKVAKAGAFTLVEGQGKAGPFRWVFEDKRGLKYAEGETFTLVAFLETGKLPATYPEELKEHPLLKLIVIR